MGVIETKAVSGLPGGRMVDGGAVPEDQAALLQPLHALVHRAGRQSGRLAEVGVGHSPVVGEQAKDLAVGLLHEAEPRGREARDADARPGPLTARSRDVSAPGGPQCDCEADHHVAGDGHQCPPIGHGRDRRQEGNRRRVDGSA